jgi:hypothetical protein
VGLKGLLGCRVPDCVHYSQAFRVLGFGFWVLGFGFRVSGQGLAIASVTPRGETQGWGFGPYPRVDGSGSKVRGSTFKVQGSRCKEQGARFKGECVLGV